jgi:hypothetical protein
MSNPDIWRFTVQKRLSETTNQLNRALRGENLEVLEPILKRLGRGQQVPHWYAKLTTEQVLPNLDGKTIGSVIEMLFVAVLESFTLADVDIPSLRVNPAQGVDLPDLELGIKSPSTNYATSEPFFGAYERLLGNEYDAVILITDYQQAKQNPPLRLQIIDAEYLSGSEMADYTLCNIARKHRAWLLREDSAWARKLFKFLAYVNQSDWRARQLIKLVSSLDDQKDVLALIAKAEKDFERKNEAFAKKDQLLIPDHDLESIKRIQSTRPIPLGVLFAADAWVEDYHKDFARSPNENEWRRLLKSPLNGRIGMSFALQWRYNFSRIFRSRNK